MKIFKLSPLDSRYTPAMKNAAVMKGRKVAYD